MFSLLRQFVEVVRNLKQKSTQDPIGTLLNDVTWAVNDHIDYVDILGWINDKLKVLLNDGVTEVNVIIGDELATFILNNQKRYNIDPSSEDIKVIRSGIILVAMNIQGQIVADHLIRSNCGLAATMIIQFKSEPILRIKIPY